MTLAKIGGLFLVLLLVVGIAFSMLPEATSVSVDFVGYYGTAGMPEWRTLLADDLALQELISWSVFQDVDVSLSHAAERHPEDQDLYKKCISDENSTIMAFINPKNDHCIELMRATVEEGGRSIEKFLIRVVKEMKGKYYEITAFSDEWDGIWEVEEYIIDDGYMEIYNIFH